MLFAVVMAVAGVVVLLLAVREVVQYLRRRDEYPLRRLTLRLCTAGMLLFLLASIYVGIGVFGLVEPRDAHARLPYTLQQWGMFWLFVMLLTLAIFALLIADFRTVHEERSTMVHDLWRDMAEIIATHEAKKREDGQE
jgi:hypothetical protein